MADYRTISSGFWNDPYIEELEPQEKLLYIYLFTCPHTNNAGILHISPRKMAFETGIDDVATLIKKFSDDEKLVECEGYFWVVNFIKHQSSTSPKIIQSIGKALNSVPVPLADRVLAHYKALQIPYAYPIDTPCIPYAEGELERERELEGEREEGESAKRGSKSDDPDLLKSPPLKNPGFSALFMAETWPDYLKRKKGKYKNLGSQEVALAQLYRLCGGDEPLAVEALTQTVANGYQGFTWFFDRQPKQQNHAAGTTKNGNPHAIANAAAIQALQRGCVAESPAGVGNRSG